MADTLLTLLDITKQNGTDQAVGIVEEVRTFAPEVSVFAGRPIKGTTYKALVRTALPGGPAFRAVNSGSSVVASRWDQRINQAFFLDGQCRVDEATVNASEFGADYVLANEASGVVKQALIQVGTQFWYGNPSTTDLGFAGFNYLYDPTTMEVAANATGSAGATNSSAWLVCNAPDCAEFIYGNNRGLQMGQWMAQYVTTANAQYRAWVNNLSAYIGLSFNYTKSACRIKNLVAYGTSSKTGLTDAVVAAALAKFPVGVVPTHLFCTRAQRFFLQQSRSTAFSTAGASAITAADRLKFSPTPTESNGIPLYVTDSLTDTENSTASGTAGI